MARAKAVAAGVFSLLLVGTQGAARADEASSTDDARPGVLSLFGKNFCFADVAPDVQCDWRLPAAAAAHTSSQTASAAQNTSAPAALPVWRLLGVDICLDNAPPRAECDIRVPPASAASTRRASL